MRRGGRGGRGIANAGSVTRFNSLIEYSISSRCDGSNEEFIFFPRRYDKSDALKNKEDDGWKWGEEEGKRGGGERVGTGKHSGREVFTFDLWYSFKSTITFFASFFFFLLYLIIVTFIFHRFHFFFFLRLIFSRLENNHVSLFFFFLSSSNDSRNNCIYIIDIQCGKKFKT